MIFFLFILNLFIGQYNVDFTVTNFKSCPFRVTLYGYNNSIYKRFEVDPGESLRITGKVPYPYLRCHSKKHEI